jgi:3-isopropylmalate/(R)-2-methylmalate dehydratase small subunit
VKFRGNACIFGDNVNTDEIIAARYLNTTDPAVLAQHCMEDIRPGFAQHLAPNQIIVAGVNFGCGSSREHAPIAIKAVGICCVVAESFARIFFRNAINMGLPIVECHGILGKADEGDHLEVDLDSGELVLPTGERRPVSPFPPFMQAIVEQGGWIPYLLSQKSAAKG